MLDTLHCRPRTHVSNRVAPMISAMGRATWPNAWPDTHAIALCSERPWEMYPRLRDDELPKSLFSHFAKCAGPLSGSVVLPAIHHRSHRWSVLPRASTHCSLRLLLLRLLQFVLQHLDYMMMFFPDRIIKIPRGRSQRFPVCAPTYLILRRDFHTSSDAVSPAAYQSHAHYGNIIAY